MKLLTVLCIHYVYFGHMYAESIVSTRLTVVAIYILNYKVTGETDIQHVI